MGMNKLLLPFLLLSLAFFLPAQQPVGRQNAPLPDSIITDQGSRRIEDDSALRAALLNDWFIETPGRVQSKRPETHTLQGGARIQVRSESKGNEFCVVLARELRGYVPAAAGNAFPGWAQGSWVLTRSKSDGAPLRIRVFLRSDPYTYIQFRPFTSDKCQMDVVIYEAYVIQSLPLAVSFDRLLVLPVEEILSLAGNRFPRKYFDPEPDMYRDKRTFIEAVRSRLPQLNFKDDGAIDQNGNYVFIETLDYQNPAAPNLTGVLNCSGFVKWIIDGILKPHTGERLPVAPLKTAFNNRGSTFTDAWDHIKDPFFGLDWNRNLASRAASVLRSPAFATLEQFEVRTWPFSQVIIRQEDVSEVRPYPGFLNDAGFGIEGLYPLLYTLAIDEPDRIYLAAVNTEIGAPVTPQNWRGLPKMRQYFHVAVLVPFFNEYGNFQIVVFESADETSFNFFRNRYPGHYVNLVKIPIDGKFSP